MGKSILITEDDPVWRMMLAQFLNQEPDMQVVCTVGTKEEAVQYCTHHLVDVVLMDLNLSPNHLDGIEATLELSMRGIPAKVIALTSLTDGQVILDAYTAGAIHYISKSDFRKIPDLIREFSNQLSPQEILVKEYTKMKENEQLNKLTAAEKEIVQLLREGHSYTDIQKKLAKTESTLKNQITKLLKSLKQKRQKKPSRLSRAEG